MKQFYSHFKILLRKYLLVLIILLFLFLSFYNLSNQMVFIGDQGWFYVSSKNILSGQIPLVGISSSHTWIHQGAFWTYILFLALLLFNFNPVSGAYISIFLTCLTIIYIYTFTKKIFSEKIALIASFLYATSPLVIVHARLPYHTSPIPLLTVLFMIALYNWAKGKKRHFAFVILTLSVLYNFELATVVLIPVFLLVVLYVFKFNRSYFKKSMDQKNILYSILFLLIPMVPFIIYDINHGFFQTIGFAVWAMLKPFSIFVINKSEGTIIQTTSFLATKYSQAVFAQNSFFAIFLFILSSVVLVKNIFKHSLKRIEYLIVSFSFFAPLFIFIVNKTPSEAYLVILFPIWIMAIAISLDKMFKRISHAAFATAFIIGILNIIFLFSNNFLIKTYGGYGVGLGEKINISKQIITKSGEDSYNLIYKGLGSEYESGPMPYQYITWWLGKEPLNKDAERTFIVTEYYDKVSLEEKLSK